MNDTKGYAMRVGRHVLVPPRPTEADIDAALRMMSQQELKRLNQQMRWSLWSLKHPRLVAVEAACPPEMRSAFAAMTEDVDRDFVLLADEVKRLQESNKTLQELYDSVPWQE